MKRIAKFEKVSLEQFIEGMKDCFDSYSEEECESIYQQINLPKRATSGSAGYDFYAPVTLTILPGETIKIPTGIRVSMEENWVLKCYPRSGLGFKFRLQLNNTVGIIDSDYYYSDNEGHIFVKLRNEGNKPLVISQGEAMCQFIFAPFLLADGDSFERGEERNGGFGSTTK